MVRKTELPPRSTILIVGASARAAAMSAIRAGLSPAAADLFADMDLRRCCPTTQIPDYPNGFLRFCAGPRPGGWIYTGALENHPRLIERIAAIRPVYGNSAEVVRAVRDPVQLDSAFHDAGIDSPAVWLDADRLPCDGSWLCKPRRSAGGVRIQPLTDRMNAERHDDFYFQKRIDGLPCSAVFVSADGKAALLGVTEQLIGQHWAGASEFRYCGSIGPLHVSGEERTAWHTIGNCLAERYGLIGLWGVDAVVADGSVRPVEVNPRYTASVEILERALGIQSLRYHLSACQDGELPTDVHSPSSKCVGKAIVYATDDLCVTGAFADWLEAVDQQQHRNIWPDLADIPPRESLVRQGWPIATVFADGANRADCVNSLQARAAELRCRAATVSLTRSDRAQSAHGRP